MRLENFLSIKAATFDFKNQSASIYGDNAAGKTTAYNAVTWFLFDRPSWDQGLHPQDQEA